MPITPSMGSLFHADSHPGRTSLDFDWDGDKYRRVLLAIGGEGIACLVEAELNRESPFARIDGLRSVLWCPTAGSRRRLRTMAENVPANHEEAALLVSALAALGEDEAFARLVGNGAPLLESVVDLRHGRLPLPSAVVADAVAALESDDPDRRQRALLVLAVSNDPGTLSALAVTLDRFPPDSAEANLAVFALDALRVFTPGLLPRVAAILAGPHRLRCVNYLLRRGGAAGRALLSADLERHRLDSLNSTDEQLAFILARHDDSRTGGLAFLRRVRARGLGFGSEGRILAALAKNGDTTVHQRLHDCAIQRAESRGGWLDAIRFIAQEDPDDAFALARRHLGRPDSLALPTTLMRIDPCRGMDELLHWLTDVGAMAMRGAIARALRRYADPAVLADRLTAMAGHADPRHREAAAEIIGWQAPGFLSAALSRLADDHARDVEAAALAAIRLHQEQVAARQLLDGIPDASNTRRWGLLTALLDLADPRLLDAEGDSLCLWPALKDLAPEYALWADEKLGERLRKVESDERQKP